MLGILQDPLNNGTMVKPPRKPLPRPPLDLTDVFDALRDPIRREIVRRLSVGENLCSAFADLGSPSGLSYHFARLRSAGLTLTRKSGTCRLLSLRKEALEAEYPGLLACVLKEETPAR
ncbi:helix-turn-helix transcriptional regulator [Acidobacteria bacterium AB60]|nr:helix-turn-helix transcriptional regulator [Acidobacteria bacterium AB60]